MTFEQLTYFLETARTLNFSKAAENLFVHNTTVCRSILNLEKEFGTPLFMREKGSLQLTELGIKLKKEGSLLSKHYDEVMRTMHSSAKTTSGHLSIVGPSAYTGFLDRAYQAFKKQYPNITYSIKDCDSGAFDEPYHATKDGKADFGVTYSTYLQTDDAEIQSMVLGDESLDILLPASHPLYGRKKISIHELKKTTILAAEFMGQDFIDRIKPFANGKSGNRLKMIHMPGDNPILLATAGFGVSFLPRTLARIGEIVNPTGSGASHAEITDFDTAFKIILVWRKASTNPAVGLYLNVISAHE